MPGRQAGRNYERSKLGFRQGRGEGEFVEMGERWVFGGKWLRKVCPTSTCASAREIPPGPTSGPMGTLLRVPAWTCLRQENNRLTRKTLGFSKEDAWLDYQAIFYMTYYNFVRTHDALKIPMETRIHEKVWRKYQKQTPMMSIGITQHVWSMDELLRFPYHKTSTNWRVCTIFCVSII